MVKAASACSSATASVSCMACSTRCNCVTTEHAFSRRTGCAKGTTSPSLLTIARSSTAPSSATYSSALMPANILLRCRCSFFGSLLLPMISSRSSSPTK